MFVYLVTGPTGKRYVGITSKTIDARWKQHVSDAARHRSNSVLHAAIRKYGQEAFSLEQIGSCDTWEAACEMEKAEIASRGTFSPDGYNLTLGGDGLLGVKHSEEFKAFISEVHKGRVVSDLTRERLRAAHEARPEHEKAELAEKIASANSKRTPEERDRIAEAIAASKRGKKRPSEVMEKVAQANRGKRRSDEAIAKTAAANRGRKRSSELRAKMSAIAKARSAESMANFIGCRKGQPVSGETRAKMAEAAQARREKTAETVREVWRQRKAAAQAGGVA